MFFSKFTEIRDRIWTRPPNFYIRPGSSAVKSLLAMWETHVRTLGREYPLEKEMVADSSVLAWGIHGQRSLAGCNSWGCKSWKRLSDHYLLTSLPNFFLSKDSLVPYAISLNIAPCLCIAHSLTLFS